MRLKKEKNKKFKKVLIILATLITWVIVGAVISWHFIVLLWQIMSFKFSKNLYIAESVILTSYNMLVVVIWAITVYILSLVWVKYNNSSFAKKRKTKFNLNHLVYIEKDIQWSEALISKVNSQNILKEVDKVKDNLSVVLYKPTSISYEGINQPQKLLNISISLMKKRKFLKGASYLRIILEHPESSVIIKNIAKVKLSQCLYELGYKDLANGLAEKVI